jgi:hypothetical protein
LAADQPSGERQHGQHGTAARRQRHAVRQTEPVAERTCRGEEQHRDHDRAEEQQQGAARRPDQQRERRHCGDDEDTAQKGRLRRRGRRALLGHSACLPRKLPRRKRGSAGPGGKG